MYQSAFTYRPRTVRFCQWSRKAYAAFASLKIQVTMGCVSKGITEVALSKNGYTAEKQSSLQGNTGFMPPEEASRASGTEMPPLPAGFCLPEREIHTPAAGSLSWISGIYSSLLFCFTVRDIHPSRIDFLFIRRNTNLIS